MKRRNVLRFAGLAAAGFGPAALLQAKLNNETIDASKAKLTREEFGELRIYFDGPTDQLKWMTAGSLLLNSGMSPHSPHQHPEEELMLITEGTGKIVVDGKTTEVGPGSMMYCASAKVHGIQNTGKSPLLFYFFKWRNK